MKSALSEIEKVTAQDKDSLMLTIMHIVEFINEYDCAELMLPEGDKRYFYARALLINELPIEKIRKYTKELMRWFQDPNWPGVDLRKR